MKPLSEFVDGLRGQGAHVYSLALAEQIVCTDAKNPELAKEFDAGMNCAADLLQAWLREAEAWTWHEADRDGAICVSDILSGLLGPTQKPKQEGEK